MQNAKLKSIFSSRFFYIVFSFLAACALWFFVSISENPNMTENFNGITIAFTGADVLTEHNLIVTEIDTESLNLEITGSRLDVARIEKEDIIVTVDMSVVNRAGTHQLEYDVKFSADIDEDDVSVTRASSNFVTVDVKKMVTKNIEIRGTFDGEVADGYIAGNLVIEPSVITVRGPEDEIALIDCARVVLARDVISKTVTDEISYSFVDKNDNEIVSDLISCDVDTVQVTQTVSMHKEVSLIVKCIDGAGAVTGDNTTIVIDPPSIWLSGDAEILEGINSITLGTVDLSSFQLSFNDDMTIVIPDGTINTSGVNKADVTIQVFNLTTTKISASNIAVKNETEGYSTEIITKSLDITLRGSEEDISQVRAENIRIVADLANQGNAEGTFEVIATVHVDGFPNVGAVGTYKVNVRITKN